MLPTCIPEPTRYLNRCLSGYPITTRFVIVSTRTPVNFMSCRVGLSGRVRNCQAYTIQSQEDPRSHDPPHQQKKNPIFRVKVIKVLSFSYVWVCKSQFSWGFEWSLFQIWFVVVPSFQTPVDRCSKSQVFIVQCYCTFQIAKV